MIRFKAKKFLAWMTVLCLILGCAAVSALTAGAVEKRGSIEVQIHADYEGLPLYLIDIGDYNNGEIQLHDRFKSLDIKSQDFTDNKVISAKLAQAEAFVKENDIEGTIGRVDINGNVTFRDLQMNKLYLIVQPIGKDIVNVGPIMIPMPQTDNEGNAVYDLKCEGKARQNGEFENRGAVILNKTDNLDEPLDGAVFSFWQKIYYTDGTGIPDNAEKGIDTEGNYYWKLFKKEFVTNENGQVYVDGLAFGSYRFIEEQAPDGFKLDNTPLDFDISEEAAVKVENGMYVAERGKVVTLDVVNELLTEYSVETPSIPASSKPSGSEESFVMAESVEQTSFPTPSKVESTTSKVVLFTSPDKTVEITGDDIVKYIAIGGIVMASLVLVIILIVVGGKNKKKDKKK